MALSDLQKQCQIAVLPLGTGNDLARVLGWGSACDDDAHLPQLLDRYEKASTKMLDRWSIMVFERGISLRRGTISHSPDAILSQFEDNAMWHLQVRLPFIHSVTCAHLFPAVQIQSIIETDDFQVVIASVRILCETVNEFVNRVTEQHRDDEQLIIKCDILR
jgi:diacylglycerol kinase (ATP)